MLLGKYKPEIKKSTQGLSLVCSSDQSHFSPLPIELPQHVGFVPESQSRCTVNHRHWSPPYSATNLVTIMSDIFPSGYQSVRFPQTITRVGSNANGKLRLPPPRKLGAPT